MKIKFGHFLGLFCFSIQIAEIISDALHPRRPETEELFIKMGHHERTSSESEMQTKIDQIRSRRSFQPWNLTNIQTQKALSNLKSSHDPSWRAPNILFLLADDLGYGDLSVPPFVTPPDSRWPCTEGGILSPRLEGMAARGMRLTNFHSASPVCSPSRVAILTGLYPWRLGAMNAFELGQDLSQRNGFLPQIPTLPELLRSAGYFTAHSGKWHLGGMREEMRVDRAYKDICTYPSPNQHGFEEYTSELDGPESPRYTFLNRNMQLHSIGHRHLIRNDVPVPPVDIPNKECSETVLSDREANDAIDYITKQTIQNPTQPWYVQVWFNAPHGPWERIKTGEQIYSIKYNKNDSYWEEYQCPQYGTPGNILPINNNNPKEIIQPKSYSPLQERPWHYKTMVTAMDVSIGRLLDALKELNIEKNTLVVFTSDNGAEWGAGTGGIYSQGKRSLHEGGVRVPFIMQWIGVLPPNTSTHLWGGTPDLLPTFLDVAGVERPEGIKFDGISLMPALGKMIKMFVEGNERGGVVGGGGEGGVGGESKIDGIVDSSSPSSSSISSSSSNSLSLSSNNEMKRMTKYESLQIGGLGRRRRRMEGISLDTPSTTNTASTTHTIRPHNNNNQQQNQQLLHHNSIHNPTSTRTPPLTLTSSSFSSSSSLLLKYPWMNQPDHSDSRVFLWHKDTDPYYRDERIQSAGYYSHIKIISSTINGCLDRIFDLKHDPIERVNLYQGGGGNCRVNFNNWSPKLIGEVVNRKPATSHCQSLATTMISNQNKNNNNNQLKNSSTSTTTTVTTTIDQKESTFIEQCLEKYHNHLVSRIIHIYPKMKSLALTGNYPHQYYMNYQLTNTTCSIPSSISQINTLNYHSKNNNNNCHNNEGSGGNSGAGVTGCSSPEY